MDALHFDALARQEAGAASRRTLLRGLGVGAVSGLLGRSPQTASTIKAVGAPLVG